MRLQGQLITNRTNFEKNFLLEDFLKSNGGQELIAELCVFFDNLNGLSEKETVLIENLDKLNRMKRAEETKENVNEIYKTAEGYFKKVREKADEYAEFKKSDDVNTNINILKALILLELAGKDGSDEDFEKFMLPITSNEVSADENGCDGTLGESAVIDLCKIYGGVTLERYGFGEVISKNNPLVMKTFVNTSEETDYELLKVREADGRTVSFRVYGGDSVNGIFAGEKLAALIPTVEPGERFVIFRDGDRGYCRKDSQGKLGDFRYEVEDVSAFCATNDGAIFVSGDKIKPYTNDQVKFGYTLEEGEKILMICEREEVYGILTNYGRLISNVYGERTNACYAVMREDCRLCVLFGDGEAEICGENVEAVEAFTIFETFNFGKRACAKYSTEIEKFETFSFFGETDAYIVTKRAGEIEITLKQRA